jgi:AcrR family transcriptional regulator
MTRRDEARRATEARIVDAAVASLIEFGYAATTALKVQNRLGISRGTLLHHFPTSEALSAAAVRKLVGTNIAAVRDEFAATPDDSDPVARGVGVLYRASQRQSFATELELWSAARADPRLHEALVAAERDALAPLQQVVREIFGPQVAAMPNYPVMVDLTVEFLRGLTVSRSLQQRSHGDLAVHHWIGLMRQLLGLPDDGASRPKGPVRQR